MNRSIAFLLGWLLPIASLLSQTATNNAEQWIRLSWANIRLDRQVVGITLARGVTTDLEKNLVIGDRTYTRVADGDPYSSFRNSIFYRVQGAPLTDVDLRRARRELRRKNGIRDVGLAATIGNRLPYVLLYRIQVQFKPGVTDPNARAIIAGAGATVVDDLPDVPQRYVVQTKQPLANDVVTTAQSLDRNRQVDFAEPLLYMTLPKEKKASCKFHKCKQWHHKNLATLDDADIDTVQAWAFNQGEDRVAAVIDDGFDISHPDLAKNLWENPDEVKDGKDNDGNLLKDDIHGYDFGYDSPTFKPTTHGTNVAGCIAGYGDNANDIKGSAPRCKLMLLACDSDPICVAKAIRYARKEGADVINLSRFDDLIPTLKDDLKKAATLGRDGKGCVVFAAMFYSKKDGVDGCKSADGSSDIAAASEHVIAVSASDEWDMASVFDIRGTCMSVMAPGQCIYTTHTATSICGALKFIQFGRTSASTPVTAGVGALIIGARKELDATQVRRVLQDTADKIAPDVASYSVADGKSSVGGTSTHGYGRINAYEAVKLVAPRAEGGRGGVDLLLRDHGLDWGNTEQPSSYLFSNPRRDVPYWESPDIKADVAPYDPPTNSVEFENFVHENPQPGKECHVYVRLRNRGPFKALEATLQLYAAEDSLMFPPFPVEFWDGLPLPPGTTSAWSRVGIVKLANVLYSGPSVANGLTSDKAVIQDFVWNVPNSKAQGFHLLAFVNSPADTLWKKGPDLSEIVPRDNNVALKSTRRIDASLTPSTVLASIDTGSGARVPTLLQVEEVDYVAGGVRRQRRQPSVVPPQQQQLTVSVDLPARPAPQSSLLRLIRRDRKTSAIIGGVTLQVFRRE